MQATERRNSIGPFSAPSSWRRKRATDRHGTNLNIDREMGVEAECAAPCDHHRPST